MIRQFAIVAGDVGDVIVQLRRHAVGRVGKKRLHGVEVAGQRVVQRAGIAQGERVVLPVGLNAQVTDGRDRTGQSRPGGKTQGAQILGDVVGGLVAGQRAGRHRAGRRCGHKSAGC